MSSSRERGSFPVQIEALAEPCDGAEASLLVAFAVTHSLFQLGLFSGKDAGSSNRSASIFGVTFVFIERRYECSADLRAGNYGLPGQFGKGFFRALRQAVNEHGDS